MNSKLYVGQVRHRRFTPHEHQFSYKMFMMYMDLDELPQLFGPFWLWSARGKNLAYYARQDHMGSPAQSLKQSVKDLVKSESGIELKGPVRLLTHLRYFGYGFNPVSFYYCFDEQDQHIEVIVAEVNNTPWAEQFCYVLPVDSKKDNTKAYTFELEKAFHVSPFNPMDQNYRWRFSHTDDQLAVHMENWREDNKVFDATLSLKAMAINSRSLRQALIHFPLMTAKISFSIYYQALKLWFKRTPIYDHPDKITADTARHQ